MPSCFEVCTSVVKMSIARTPARLRLCRLTSRRRALTRACNSDALLCSGTDGFDNTVNNWVRFSAVLAIRASKAAYPVRLVNNSSNSRRNDAARAALGLARYCRSAS